jgi:hypothetical protein
MMQPAATADDVMAEISRSRIEWLPIVDFGTATGELERMLLQGFLLA